MKKLIVLATAVLLPVALCHAQSGADIVTELKTEIHPDLVTLQNKADSMIALATSQLSKLSDLAKDSTMQQVASSIDNLDKTIGKISNIIGDPAAVPHDKFDRLHDRVQDWINDGKLPDPPMYDKGINAPTSSGDGNQAFGTTAGGLFQATADTLGTPIFPIGSSFTIDTQEKDDKGATKSVTKTINRDASLYAGPVDELASVRSYFDLREKTISRREQLQSLLQDTLDDLRNSKDFATVAKDAALAEAIESQLKACNDDLNTVFNDTAVRALQNFAMSQIQTAATSESMNAQMQSKKKQYDDVTKDISKTMSTPTTGTSEPGDSATTLPAFHYKSGILPWYKYKY